MRSVPASIAASNTWRDPSTLISCARSPSPMMAKARWTTTSASLTASRTLFLSRTSPWRYSVLRQPSDAGSNGRRARPTIRFTRRERSSASTTARPRSPVGPVTATVRPVLATRAFISKRPRQSREDAQASLGGGEALSREKHRSEGRGLGWRARCAASAVALLVAGLAAAPATNAARIPARPIPEGETNAPGFVGAPARPNPLFAPAPPRHPFMAPNARSNIHNDAYASDVYFAQGGPLGHGMQRRSTLQFADCGSLAFDSRDRVVTICVGLVRPRLMLFDPKTLDTLASFELPPRDPSSGDPFSGFSGGRYFYLDERDRVVTSTPNRQVWVIGQRSTRMGPAFARERVYDLSRTVPVGDQIVSVLPDFDGRLWFVSAKGLVGTIAREAGPSECGGWRRGDRNSFSVDETGGVYIVSDAARYRFDASPAGAPRVTWREVYDNDGVQKPSQVTAGSGPTRRRWARSRGDHGQRRPREGDRVPARQARERVAARVHRARVRAPRERDREQPDRPEPLADRREQLRVHRPGGHADGPLDRSGADARRRRPRARPLPDGVGEPRARALGRPEVVASLGARLHVHQAAGPGRRRPVVLHGARLPYRSHRLQAARRRGVPLQQQLRADQHRARLERVRWGARRTRAEIGR